MIVSWSCVLIRDGSLYCQQVSDDLWIPDVFHVRTFVQWMLPAEHKVLIFVFSAAASESSDEHGTSLNFSWNKNSSFHLFVFITTLNMLAVDRMQFCFCVATFTESIFRLTARCLFLTSKKLQRRRYSSENQIIVKLQDVDLMPACCCWCWDISCLYLSA